MTLALVDNRVRVRVLKRDDQPRYSFVRRQWEPARETYLVQCEAAPPGVPCEHFVAPERLTLLVGEEGGA